MSNPKSKVLTALLILVAVSGCTSFRAYREAQMAESTGDWDQAVLYYMEAVERDPNNINYRADLLRAKVRASQAHYDKARRYQESGVLERALVEYQQAVTLDPSNQSALVELNKVRQQLAAEREQKRLDTSIEEMKRRAREANQPPVLNPRSDEPIDLDFPEPVSIKDIYRALGRAFGINVLFDPNLKDQEIAIELKQVTAQKALETLMRAAGHFYKVEDEHTIIIAADTPQNRRNYEDLVIQTFFLSNAEVKDVVTMLRSLIDAKKIATNEQLNAIILRDTADKVKVAERIILANDKARAEVVVDVELLQINTNKLRELGVNWPGSVTATVSTGDTTDAGAGVIRLSDVEFLNQNNWVLTIPSFVYNFVKTNTDAQLLARPQLRISEGENASLLIGDRVPIPVTSFNTSNTVGGNIVPITSFQYQDVGITINLEPRVHHNKEVTLTIRVEVSNLSGEVTTGGQSQPIIGTRTIESTIRLKDGETTFMAGLIRTDEANSESGVPGLSSIPVIGRLFSNNRAQNQRTDVILTLTPHIIRSADITEDDLQPIWVGTEQNITFRGGSPRLESDNDGPFDQGGASAEDIRELIRQRIQRLPRGLRGQAGAIGGAGETPAEPPAGTELVPPPTQRPSPFQRERDQPPPDEEEPPQALRPTNPEPEVPENLFSDDDATSTTRFARYAPRVVPASLSRRGRATTAAWSHSRRPTPVLAGERPVRLDLAAARPLVARGERFEVQLLVDAAVPVSHLPLVLRYDPQLLEVEAVERGAFLGADGEAQLLADWSEAGSLVIGASRLGQTVGVIGRGELARVTFRALASGSGQLRIERGRALDDELGEIAPLPAAATAIEVLPEAVRPERPRPAARPPQEA